MGYERVNEADGLSRRKGLVQQAVPLQEGCWRSVGDSAKARGSPISIRVFSNQSARSAGG